MCFNRASCVGRHDQARAAQAAAEGEPRAGKGLHAAAEGAQGPTDHCEEPVVQGARTLGFGGRTPSFAHVPNRMPRTAACRCADAEKLHDLLDTKRARAWPEYMLATPDMTNPGIRATLLHTLQTCSISERGMIHSCCCNKALLFDAHTFAKGRLVVVQVREQCRGEPRYEAIGSVRAKERLFRTYQDTLAQLEALTRQRLERAQAGFKVSVTLSTESTAEGAPQGSGGSALNI